MSDPTNRYRWTKFRLAYRQRLLDAGVAPNVLQDEESFQRFASTGWLASSDWNTHCLTPAQAAEVAALLEESRDAFAFDERLVNELTYRAEHGETYFQEGTFADDWRAFYEAWYGCHLETMREPRLTSPSGELAVRFLWLRTFDAPGAIRLSTDGLVVKRTSGRGGYAPGKLVDDRVIRLSEAAVSKLVGQAQMLWEHRVEPCHVLDGAEWIVELADRERYRCVHETSPETGPIRAFGEAMLKRSKLNESHAYEG